MSIATPTTFKVPPGQNFPSGQGTFSDNLVGNQTVDGGGLTQGNFDFTQTANEKENRQFITGAYSQPISLSDLSISDLNSSSAILNNNVVVNPNFDLTKLFTFTQFGSLSQRISVSITNIINYFPAALEVYSVDIDLLSGNTAININYTVNDNETYFEVPVIKFRNPFGIDYSVNATQNLINMSSSGMTVSGYRNLPSAATQYSLFYNNNEYQIVALVPSPTLFTGVVGFYVLGQPFSGASASTDSFIVRPTTLIANQIFINSFDDVELFLLNQLSNPIYTAIFETIGQTDNGKYYTFKQPVTWPLDGMWNLDIRTPNFDNYLDTVNEITTNLDDYKTNLISRFLTTGSLKDFDTPDQKFQSILQIYGRSFDELKKYVSALAYINSINYNIGNDTPSELLVYILKTIGWTTNMSTIANTYFLDALYSASGSSQYEGFSRGQTPQELDYQYYRNLILNSAYLFKSKGTRKSIEILMKLIGIPEALTEFNEHVYMADGPIDTDQFNIEFANISGGTFVEEQVVLDPTNLYKIHGQQFSGFSISSTFENVNVTLDNYPVDDEGFPSTLPNTASYYFQKGAGWFESTPQHRADTISVNDTNVFTGQSPYIQTQLAAFTYGQPYLDAFRHFDFMNIGFTLSKTADNRKSWTVNDLGYRVGEDEDSFSRYYVSDERLVLNVKNIELYVNPAQGILYDIWNYSLNNGYPIPNGSPYFINIPTIPNDTISISEPNQQTFLEFANTFWQTMIDVKNRLYITDYKTGAYPILESVFFEYLQAQQITGIPTNNFTYQNMIEYSNGLGDKWIRLVEQMIPATTIFTTGIKYENSILHRQKVAYKVQRGCGLLQTQCMPCISTSTIFQNNCNMEIANCFIFPWDSPDSTTSSFSDILYQTLNNYLTANNFSISNCILNTLITNWYIDLRVDGVILLQTNFFNGFGITGVPTDDDWLNALNTDLQSLINDGFGFYIVDNVLHITSLGCTILNNNKQLQLNVGINIQINCSESAN